MTNAELLNEYIQSIELGKPTDNFVDSIAILIRQNFNKRFKHHKFLDYEFQAKMEEAALRQVMKNWATFDTSKSTNVTAFFTTCITGAFVRYISDLRKKLTREESSDV